MSDHDDLDRPKQSAYMTNRCKLPPEDVAQYAGEWLAWNLDGTQVLAHGPDLDAVIGQLEAAGIGAREVIWEEVPPYAG